MAEQWTLAQLVAWVARRRAVPFEGWDDNLFPPRGEVSPMLHEGAVSPSVSASAARAIAAQDDGIGEAMHAAALQVKAAAAAGTIALRGRRVEQDPERAADEPISAIPADVFSRPSLGFYVASGSIGAGEVGVTPGATATARDTHSVPGWLDVSADAAAVQMVWPPVSDVDEWMLAYAGDCFAKRGRPPFRDKEAIPDAKAAGFPVDPARKAYARLPAHLKGRARNPRRSAKT